MTILPCRLLVDSLNVTLENCTENFQTRLLQQMCRRQVKEQTLHTMNQSSHQRLSR